MNILLCCVQINIDQHRNIYAQSTSAVVLKPRKEDLPNDQFVFYSSDFGVIIL